MASDGWPPRPARHALILVSLLSRFWNDCSDRFPGHPSSVDAIVKYDDDLIITGSADGLIRVLSILPNKARDC